MGEERDSQDDKHILLDSSFGPRSYVAVVGKIESPTEIITELIAGSAEDPARFWRLAQTFADDDVSVVRRELLESFPGARAKLKEWDEVQGGLTIRDEELRPPRLVVVREQSDVPGWIGVATRLRADPPQKLLRRERLMLRSLQNVENAARLAPRVQRLRPFAETLRIAAPRRALGDN